MYKVPDFRKSMTPSSFCSPHTRRRGGTVSIFKTSPVFPRFGWHAREWSGAVLQSKDIEPLQDLILYSARSVPSTC